MSERVFERANQRDDAEGSLGAPPSAGRSRRGRWTGAPVSLKSSADIGAMREAGQIVASALAAARQEAAVGTTLRTLDAVAEDGDPGAGSRSAVQELPPPMVADAVPGGDLHIGQRRRGARHPQPLPPA